MPSPPSRVVPGWIQFLATLDHSTYGTPYSIYIYDEDDSVWPAICGQQQCAKNVLRQWADNANPKPGRVRVEVRDAAGDVASNTVYAQAPFRRFIFTPTLSFWSHTMDGTVIHKASARLAAGDPSLYGTPYQIKITKADGTVVCSAPQYGCDATVTVGDTYRATVEDSTGRWFGSSGAWTLTSSGPESLMMGGVDLAFVASKFANMDALCEEILLRGGNSGNGNTLPDPYETCLALLAEGVTVSAALLVIIDVVGGPEVVHQISGSQIAPPLPAPGEATPEDSIATRPLPYPIWLEIDKLTDRLQTLNETLDATGADQVATQCKLFMSRISKAADECLDLRIFAPGSDMPAITKHNLTAIGNTPIWVRLAYDNRGASKPGYGEWYKTEDGCRPGEYDTKIERCDEYPFMSTRQGGPSPFGGIPPSLLPVPLGQNSAQGGHLSAFYGRCGLSGRPIARSSWSFPFPGLARSRHRSSATDRLPRRDATSQPDS